MLRYCSIVKKMARKRFHGNSKNTAPHIIIPSVHVASIEGTVSTD